MEQGPGIQTQGIQDYLNEFGLREPALLRELREETTKRWRGFLLQPTTGQFLDFLIRTINAKYSLDIGCFTGYSALVAALAMGENSRVISLDTNTEWTVLAKEYWKKADLESRIELRIQPALTSLDQLIANSGAGKFDFAFIDADKSNYSAYVERAYALVREGGLIVLDNTLWRGLVADPETTDTSAVLFRDLNHKLQKDGRFDFTLLPVGDGVTVLRKR